MKRSNMRFIRGFSIVELMVGLVISMVVSLAVFQTFGVFEAQKRTTTSGADAQTNGLVALQSLERDLKMAGDGFANDWLQGCTNVFHYYNAAGAAVASPIPNFSLGAVSILDGGAGGAPDTIIVRRGNSVRSNGPIGLVVAMTNSSSPLQVTEPMGFFNNDIIVVADKPPGANCSVMQVSSVNNFGGGAAQINHVGGAGAPYNAPGLGTWPAHGDESQVFNLGALLQRTYSINAGMLQSQDFPAAAGLILASDIVQLQAQYGVDQDLNESIDCWTNATGGCGLAAAPTPAQARTIKAVRIALVARSALQERGDAGGTCDATKAYPTAWLANGSITLDLSADANWRCYRYRVYETTVPLRNVIWGNVSQL
jgi:type IV pilus assembly protein PilW